MKNAQEHSRLMDAATENSIRQQQVESLGRLMAGFSHDMKNHMGIIRESNGLISDLLAMGGLGDNERVVQQLTKAIASIEKRVVVVADMLHHLSGLAHRPDTPCSSFNVNDLITEEFTFLQRFSRLKQIDVTLELGEGGAAVYNDPALLQHIFFRLFSACLDVSSAGDTLAVITNRKEGGIEIVFRLVTTLESLSQVYTDTLQAAVEKLAGRVESTPFSQDQSDIVLTIPTLGG